MGYILIIESIDVGFRGFVVTDWYVPLPSSLLRRWVDMVMHGGVEFWGGGVLVSDGGIERKGGS